MIFIQLLVKHIVCLVSSLIILLHLFSVLVIPSYSHENLVNKYKGIFELMELVFILCQANTISHMNNISRTYTMLHTPRHNYYLHHNHIMYFLQVNGIFLL